MKIRSGILILIITLINPIFAFTQKTLEFNQIKLVTNVEETVPAGKVWKIESIMPNTAVRYDNGYSIKINSKTIYVHTYSAGIKYWDNISSIVFEGKWDGTSCTGGGTYLVFSYNGSESGLPFQNRSKSSSNYITTSWTNYQNLFTVTPQNLNNALSITSFRLYTTNYGGSHIPVKIRMTVNYSDGTTQQTEYNGGCCCGNSYYDIIGSSSSYFQVQAASRDYFYTTMQLPAWLPENTTLKADNNIEYISVIEYNVIP